MMLFVFVADESVFFLVFGAMELEFHLECKKRKIKWDRGSDHAKLPKNLHLENEQRFLIFPLAIALASAMSLVRSSP